MSNITKTTRKESFNKVNKTLGERQLMVLDYLKALGNSTARELAIEMWKDGNIIMPERNMVHPRLNELVKLGLVKVTGKKMDEDMNRMVETYDLGDK